MNIPQASRPWHREPFMWLVVGIPALTVVAGLSTLFIAHHHADPVVSDDYRKEGLAIQHDPARDQAAVAAGARAVVALGGDRMQVELTLSHGDLPATLAVVLSHATRAELDRLVTLTRTPQGTYFAPLPPLQEGHWYLELSPADRGWRLRGDFTGTPTQLTLEPGRMP